MKISMPLWSVLRVGEVPRPPLLRRSCACCQANCEVSIAVLFVKQRRTSASKTPRASETNDGGVWTNLQKPLHRPSKSSDTYESVEPTCSVWARSLEAFAFFWATKSSGVSREGAQGA